MLTAPWLAREDTFLRTINIGTGQICRQQVGRELQAMEITFDAFREHLNSTCLGQTRCTLNEKVSVTQERDQHTIDQMGLADNQPARMCFKFLKLFSDAH